jgi:hypothetical protein
MKNLIKVLLVFFILTGITYSQPIPFLPTTFRSLNFQSAGFVTEVIPAINTTGDLNQQVLYAKTDVGGIYKSSDNGVTWTLITTYHESDGTVAFSEYIIAGFAVNPYYQQNNENGKNELLVAWGDIPTEASNSNIHYQCIWRSTDGGLSWYKSNIPYPPNGPGVLFQGDNLQTKVGGECILYDPRSGQQNRVFMGGIDPNGGSPSLFMSLDNGANFTNLQTIFQAVSQDTIVCIAMNWNRDEIFIGTAKGIYKSQGFDLNTPKPFFKMTVPSGIGGKNVRKILMKNDGKVFIAFGTNDNFYVEGGGICLYDTNNTSQLWTDLTGDFGTYNASKENYFCMLTFADEPTESILLSGRLNNPIRKSTNDGLNWGGEANGWDNNYIYLQYSQNQQDIYNFPNHQFRNPLITGDEGFTYMFGGLNSLVKNPNNCTNCGNTWYVSGGAGLRITTSANTPAPSSDIFDGLSPAQWYYSGTGNPPSTYQSMPVIYDFTFEQNPLSASSRVVYIPMADWTMAWTYQPNLLDNNNTRLFYDNQITRSTNPNNHNTWASNITRCLMAAHSDPGEIWTYNIGTDTYDPSGDYKQTAVLYKRVKTSSGINTPTRSQQDPILNTDNRAIVDGLIFDYNYNPQIVNDMMIVLLGTIKYQDPPLPTDIGIYWTTDQGINFTKANVNLPSTVSGYNTATQFGNSIIPSLRADPQFGYLYSDQFNFAIGNNQVGSKNPYLYIYLPLGGMFYSADGGKNWAYTLTPSATLNPGCLRYLTSNQLLLTIQGQGLFYGYLNSDGTINSWKANYDGFTEASQVEVKDNIWVIFGKKSGDLFPRLYKTTNYGNNWTHIADGLRGVRAMRIDPLTLDLFIGTTGLGTLVYNDLSPTQPIFVKNNLNISFNTYFMHDIEIDSGGVLNLSGNISFKMAQDKRIYVKEGGKLVANNVTFNCLDSTQKWQGIYFENSEDSCIVQNCTINNATLPIEIKNDEDNILNEKIISNNVFNCQFNNDYTIFSANSLNLKIEGNQFNMKTGTSNTTGIYVKNNINYYSMGLGDPAIIKIIGNTFNDGNTSLILTSYATLRTPYYIAGNTFTGNSVQYNLIGRMMTGRIRNNNFSSSSTTNPIYLDQSDPDFYQNTINGSGTTVILDANSFANLAPLSDENNFYWYGGLNNLTSANAGNIIIADAGNAFTNNGANIFSKNSSNSYYHISGIFDTTENLYSARNNGWCPGQLPYNYLWSTYNPSINTDYNGYFSNCIYNNNNVQITGLQIVNKGQGIYDTIYYGPNNSQQPPPDELLNTQANQYYYAYQYLDAIINYKSLIDSFPGNGNVNGGGVLYNLYDAYEALDTGSTQSYTDNLYSDLENYLNAKIQSNNYTEQFNDIAYYLINICKANEQKYQESLTGFQFIAMYHPDAEVRLLASWDASEVEDLMNQSAGEGKELSELEFKNKLLSKFDVMVGKDSTMRMIKRIFDSRNKEIEDNIKSGNNSLVPKEESKNQIINSDNFNKLTNPLSGQKINLKSKGNEGSKSKIEENEKSQNGSKNKNIISSNSSKKKIQIDSKRRTELITRAENNLRISNSLTEKQKVIKQKEDILLLAGLHSKDQNSEDTKNNLPTVYNLSQNYPNPFNPITKINYQLPKDSKVSLVVYDILGREMIKLVNNEFKNAGSYTLEFNGQLFASGVYFYRLIANDYVKVKKMVLIK